MKRVTADSIRHDREAAEAYSDKAMRELSDSAGVAAPLEGTPLIEKLIANYIRLVVNPHLHKEVIAVAEAYASAVSKNSREDLAESEEDLANAIMELRKAEARISELEQRNNKIVEFVNNTWLKNRPDVEEDGYGGGAVNPCLECGLRLMEVVRPGKVQCSLCG